MCVCLSLCPSVQILTPRKLFVLASKVSVFPSNAISLQEASPRYDDAKGTIHLDVSDRGTLWHTQHLTHAGMPCAGRE